LTKLCTAQGCYIDKPWELRLTAMGLGSVWTLAFHMAQKNTKEYGGHLYKC